MTATAASHVHPRPLAPHVMTYLVVLVPFVALLAAVPLAWGWGLPGSTSGWPSASTSSACSASPSASTATSPTARSRPAARCAARSRSRAASPCRATCITWVADHRRHHAFADKEGDPHSPWLLRHRPRALAKGFWHAHLGWLFEPRPDQRRRYTPDLLADPDIVRVSRRSRCGPRSACSRPALIGGLVTMSWWGALTAFFWAGLVRVAVLHHVTWSINSICHMIGERPFEAARPLDQRLAAGDPVDGRVVAQPAPRRPHLRSPRRAARRRSTCPPASSGSSRSSAGPRTCGGRSRSGWRSCARPDRVCPVARAAILPRSGVGRGADGRGDPRVPAHARAGGPPGGARAPAARRGARGDPGQPGGAPG